MGWFVFTLACLHTVDRFGAIPHDRFSESVPQSIVFTSVGVWSGSVSVSFHNHKTGETWLTRMCINTYDRCPKRLQGPPVHLRLLSCCSSLTKSLHQAIPPFSFSPGPSAASTYTYTMQFPYGEHKGDRPYVPVDEPLDIL